MFDPVNMIQEADDNDNNWRMQLVKVYHTKIESVRSRTRNINKPSCEQLGREPTVGK